MFRWEPEGRYRCTKSMVIAPFWFSTEHCRLALTPFWLSSDDIYVSRSSISRCFQNYFYTRQKLVSTCMPQEGTISLRLKIKMKWNEWNLIWNVVLFWDSSWLNTNSISDYIFSDMSEGFGRKNPSNISLIDNVTLWLKFYVFQFIVQNLLL